MALNVGDKVRIRSDARKRGGVEFGLALRSFQEQRTVGEVVAIREDKYVVQFPYWARPALFAEDLEAVQADEDDAVRLIRERLARYAELVAQFNTALPGDRQAISQLMSALEWQSVYDVTTLLAEVARLTAALEQIASETQQLMSAYLTEDDLLDAYMQKVARMQQVAAEALKR